MKPNCHRIIISSFKVQENLFDLYYTRLWQTITSSFPNFDLQANLKKVPEEQFATQVLADPSNVGICYAPIGMVESSILNRIVGIRAAIVHNKYIAEMCRKHNDANVCVIGVQSIGIGLSTSIAIDYINSAFDNQERNMLRLGKIKDLQANIQSL